MLQTIMLPRQARDKRSESTQNRGACFAGAPTGSCGGFAHGNCSATDSMEVVRKLCVVRKPSFVAIYTLQTIFLPRQARDRHRESTQEQTVAVAFLYLVGQTFLHCQRYQSCFWLERSVSDASESLGDRSDLQRCGTRTLSSICPEDSLSWQRMLSSPLSRACLGKSSFPRLCLSRACLGT